MDSTKGLARKQDVVDTDFSERGNKGLFGGGGVGKTVVIQELINNTVGRRAGVTVAEYFRDEDNKENVARGGGGAETAS
jgi:F0F1-type ATP synthase beta subunit